MRAGWSLDRWEHAEWLSNTWLLTSSGVGAVVDPAIPTERILHSARQRNAVIRHIILTHHHFDHACGAEALQRETGARLLVHVRELPLLDLGPQARASVGSGVVDGDRIEIGGLSAVVMHIPGHTAGQMALHVEGVGVFTGDTLFRGSIGGTVAPGHTDFPDLRRSLMERLLSLPDDTEVYPGHALPTSIGRERNTNPFLLAMRDLEQAAGSLGGEEVTFDGRRARLIVWAADYDGGHKAWIRFIEDGTEAVVPGSRVRRGQGA